MLDNDGRKLWDWFVEFMRESQKFQIIARQVPNKQNDYLWNEMKGCLKGWHLLSLIFMSQ